MLFTNLPALSQIRHQNALGVAVACSFVPIFIFRTSLPRYTSLCTSETA